MESFVTRIGDVTIERVAPKAPPSSTDGGENEQPPDLTMAKSSSESETSTPNQETTEKLSETTTTTPEMKKDESANSKDEAESSDKNTTKSDKNAPLNHESGADESVDSFAGQDPEPAYEGEYEDYPEDEEYPEMEEEGEGELDPQDFLENARTVGEDENEDDEEGDEMMMPLAEAVLSEVSSKGSVENDDSSRGDDEGGASAPKRSRSTKLKQSAVSSEINAAMRVKVKEEPVEVNGDDEEDESEMRTEDEKEVDSSTEVKDEDQMSEETGGEEEQMAVREGVEDDTSDEKVRRRKSKSVDQEAKGEGEGSEDQGDGEMKKKLRTREKRKIVVEDDSEESEEEKKKKRKRRKKKGGDQTAKDDDSESTEETESEDDGSGKKKKKKKKGKKGGKKKEEDEDGSGNEKSERKATNLRRNIREVMDETQLDESTLAAQRQEMERLRRVQEQQRMLREMAQQRQQQQKAENRVISLLQGNTSILKQVSVGTTSQSSSSGSKPNTVVVKLGSGANAQTNKKVLELLRVPKGTSALPSAKPGTVMKPSVTRTLVTKPRNLQGQTMMTPSVSIAPVRPGLGPAGPRPTPMKTLPMIQAQASYSASEGEEDLDEEEDEDDLLDEGEIRKKKKDVVTISSSSSSEDDCIVLSEPSDGADEEEEEDPTNSGMHTNDSYNVPDEEGRVQVNMGKPEGDPDIFLAPHIARIIKPHQVGGIRFLYDNVIESIERFSTSTGFGCILAHSMGLGKTLQVISFCDIFLRHTPAKTVMCIMPINTLQNWLAEFNMWLPEDATTSPLAAHGEVRPRNFGLFVLNDSHKTLKARAKVIDDWSTNGGVLLIGYEMYRQLSLKKVSKPKKSRAKKKVASDEEEVDPEIEEKRQKEMLDKVHEALVKPGPDLVICDEGHRIKNSHASISVALKQIRSKRRVVLTGYPLQNNLLEYWCMVDFVRPNYLGSKTEFCNMFERPIQNGQCIDSTPQDIRLMRYRAHVLHSLLEGFVQRRSHAVLQNALPQKEEYVLLVRMTPFQRKLYDTFMNEVVRTKAVPNPLKAFAVCCKIWNHPDVLYQFLKKREGGEGVDLDLEEAAAALQANTVIDPTGTVAEERRTTSKSRSKGGSSKSRKKAAPKDKPAAAVMPNTTSQQGDSSNPFGMSGQYPVHNQLNQNSMLGSYNAYNASHNQPQYSGPFSSMPHHYNPNNPYGHSGYGSNSTFNSNNSSMGMSGQAPFPGSSSSAYGDSSMASSPASQSSQFGSSSNQSMFPGTSSSSTPSASTSGYGGMGPPFFSGNSPSNQHSLSDGFGPPSSYGQNWSGSSGYNSFSQNQAGTQPSFPNQGYGSNSQSSTFQGYNASGPGPSNSSFNPSMYGPSGSGSGSGSAPPYQQGMMGQTPMMSQNMMQPSSRSNHSMNPNMLLPQQSPVNASGMLPGGAPTKAPSMIPPSMNANMMGPGIGLGMGSSLPTMNNMGENMIGHHGMNMASNMYQNPNMMGIPGQSQSRGPSGPMAALTNMANSDVPPSAEELLHSSTDDFSAFDPSMGNMMDNVKKSDPQSMYDMKDRSMFDPWSNSQSHPPNYQDVKPMEESISKVKLENDSKFDMRPMSLDHLKNEMRDVKLEDKKENRGEPKAEGDNSQDTTKDMESDRSEKSWQVGSMEVADKDKEVKDLEDKEKEVKEDEEEVVLGPDGKPVAEVVTASKPSAKEDPGIPYDWAVELMKDYVPGLIENSAKMELFFCILEESLALGDRILVFSQSLFTLSLIEDFLQRSYIPIPGVYERWQRNRTYFRLDGSTAALEREKLINEFNTNPNVYMFLVSTRAGSLGINLVGANRVIVFDASWNPCHDTQAVCRVYRYGQKKPCFVYRLVMDNCLEKKIYDRQINKQGMSDRVVDECNPDAHLSIKEVTNLCWDDEKDTDVQDFSVDKDKHIDVVMQKILEKHGKVLSKAPFQHESLLVDRKDKKLSQAEKRLAKRSYEMEKRASNRPVYNYYNAGQGGLQIRAVQRDAAGNVIKPVASVRPMQSELSSQLDRGGTRSTKWIPAEVWQRQGMSAQEMTLPLDVVIPTNSPERASIVLKAGQRVMVLKSPKGIYMQLENGKIIAIRTAFKMGANKGGDKPFASDKDEMKKGVMSKGNIKLSSGIHPLRNNPNITITPRNAPGGARSGIRPLMQRPLGARMQNPANMRPWVRPGGVAGRAVQLRPGQTLRPGIRSLSPSVTVTPTTAKVRSMGPVSITPQPTPATNASSTKPATSNDSKGKTEPPSDSQMEDAEKDDCKGSDDTSVRLQINQDIEVMPVSDGKSIKINPDSGSDGSSWSASDRSGERVSNEIKEDRKWNDDHDSHSQSSDDRGKADPSEHTRSRGDAALLPSDVNPADGDEGNVPKEAISRDPGPNSTGPLSVTAADTTKSSLKNFRHATSSQRRLQQEQQQHQKTALRESSGDNHLSVPGDVSNNGSGSQPYPPGNIYSEFNKTSPNPMSLSGNFPGSTAGSSSKQFSSGVYSNDIHSPGYSASSDHSTDEGKSQKSPAEPRGVKKDNFPPPSSGLDNQWKSPQAFSPGLPSGKTSSHPTSLESPAYDDNSNTSAHSNVSTKSSSNAAATEARTSNSEGPMSMYYGADSATPLMKSSSSSRSHSQPSNQTSSSSSKSSTSASTPVTSSVPSVTTPSSFPALDPYANLYGSYGTYPGGLPTSNYYSPYSYPPGFLPDPKAPLPSKSSTETSSSAESTSRQHSSNSKSSSARSETKKTSHESSRSSRSDLSLPSAYESRQPAASASGSSRSSSTSAASSSSSASAPTSSVTPDAAAAAFPPGSSAAAAAAAAAAYNPMMMSPSFNPTSCQYPAPPTASNPANPFTAAAAAAANYAAPYPSPYGYGGANQFESDLARASMYSAFHRPDPGQFPAGSALDPGSPYLPLPAHTRAMNPAAPPPSSFYSQNMYGSQYGSARDPYAQLPPYAANPFMMPAPYGGLPPSSAPSSSGTSSDQPQSQ